MTSYDFPRTSYNVIVFFLIIQKDAKLLTSSLWYFKVKHLSFHMPQTRVQYLCNILCNRKTNVIEFIFVHGSCIEVVNLKAIIDNN